MKISILMLITSIFITSCQTGQYKGYKREIANSTRLAKFLSSYANKAGTSVDDLEKSIIGHIQSKGDDGVETFKAIGLTEEQSKSLKNLSESDAPYMAKVEEWIAKNIRDIKSIKAPNKVTEAELHEMFKNSFDEIRNPYFASRTARKEVEESIRRRTESKKSFSIKKVTNISSLQKEYEALFKEIILVKSAGTRKLLRENITQLAMRAKDEPEILANGLRSIEASLILVRKTGNPGIGKGCREFYEAASASTLASKADIDMATATSRDIASVSSSSPKVEIEEAIDLARMKAFSRKTGLTDDEAISAIKNLKKEPCRVY